MTTTYLERSNVADREAQAARVAADADKFARFKSETKGVEQHTVKAVNLGREMGISFQEYYLPAGEVAAEVYFREHYAKNLRMSYAVFKWFLAIGRRMDEPAKCMKDAMPALQMSLFAGGFL